MKEHGNLSIISATAQCGDVHVHDDPSGAKAQTHLLKELEGRKYYQPESSPAPSSNLEAAEDLNSPN